MNEELISFETASLFKEIGGRFRAFPWNYGCYRLEDKKLINKDVILEKDQLGDGHLPTQALLQKWLRELYKIHVEVGVYASPDYCVCVVDNFSSVHNVYNPNPHFSNHPRAFETYEKALEAGLYKGLKLIQNEKEKD